MISGRPALRYGVVGDVFVQWSSDEREYDIPQIEVTVTETRRRLRWRGWRRPQGDVPFGFARTLYDDEEAKP